jgi:hypothetical protein
MESLRAKVDQAKLKMEEVEKNEEQLQGQLQEARNLNATLVKKVEKKRSEMMVLKEDLSKTNQLMEETTRDREEMYESRIATLEQPLPVSMNMDRYTRLEQECTERTAGIVEKDNDLNQARLLHAEQRHTIEDLQLEIQELEKQTERKFKHDTSNFHKKSQKKQTFHQATK